jgi:glycosyltransferase involved in cell wall biosynthesis
MLRLKDGRLHVTFGENQGRAAALANAVSGAQGKFTMLFDDDDELYPEGLARVLEDCTQPLPSDVAGYVYHLSDHAGRRLGDAFGTSRSNFLKLRNDLRIRGDKKEVVRTDLLKPVVLQSCQLGRRVPTSLYWTTISLDHDILCRDIEIGRKHYEPGGMSDRIKRLKNANPRPLVELYRTQVTGFRKGRFRSPVSAARAVLAMTYHYSNMVRARVLRRT